MICWSGNHLLHVETASASCIKSVFYIWKIYGEAGKKFSTIYCLFKDNLKKWTEYFPSSHLMIYPYGTDPYALWGWVGGWLAAQRE